MSKKAKSDRQSLSDDDSEEENVYTVERIAGKKVKRGKVYYYIKWEGYPESQNTWELVDDVFCKELIDEFESKLKAKQQQQQSEGATSVDTKRTKSPPVSIIQETSNQSTPEIPDSITTATATTTTITTTTPSHVVESPQKQAAAVAKRQRVTETTPVATGKKANKGGKKKTKTDNRIFIEDRAKDCGFEYGDEVEQILGAQEIEDPTQSSGKRLMFYVKWKGKNAASFILSHEANTRIPQQVIQFYESRLRFQDPPSLSS
eukprot:TRINITY_DN629_c0_g1_i8.p1 TRINITY_DN629_c0_g1~~TRINITY_DN629_c0_g1_i8.p1  ORF type:complete len:261 (+),score=75.10 TRINITY_DN629_c0_g1_i8:175-957(+)